ncbi:unnamed protein product [Dibothriocephalus latus]|uniref:Phosphoglycolate phosphatase n=1 Tax=Dibothriocephalus latus TaxID=60516 RepID=A0A3P7MD44_DIBLA|nr:unnamed protein product [Dibothriocephalus latus]
MLQRCRTFMFDLDGTLWTPSGVIPGAIELVSYLKESGRQCLLITNNSSKSIDQNYEKCRKLGLPVDKSDIICTAAVAAYYLSKKGIRGPVYVLGREGLASEFDKLGISYFGIGEESTTVFDFDPTALDNRTQAVLSGYDPYFNYTKLMKAATLIGRGCPFYATNEDSRLPASGYVLPGTGSLVAAVRVASGKEPVVLGKPHKPIFDYIVETRNINPEQTIMVGDRLDTDIAFGNNFGLYTAAVMTGVTDDGLLAKTRRTPGQANCVPDIVYPSVMDMYKQLVDLDKNLY